MNVNKARIVLSRIILVSLAIIGVGYISSAVSQLRCENAEALFLINGPLQNYDLYLTYGDAPSQEIFSRVNAKYTLHTFLPVPNRSVYLTLPGGKPMPPIKTGGRVAVAGVSHARINLPFFASVQRVVVNGSDRGHGYMSHYLCFFGAVVKIREESLVTYYW